MIISFYGVRGSTAVPGPTTVKYGGNTSCVHIELDTGHDLVLDAGTGIRLLGQRLAAKSTPVNILLSHAHWDHIQGYPFFDLIYQPNRDINAYISKESGRGLLSALFEQMDGVNFPVHVEDLPSFHMPRFKGIESELYEREGVRVIRQPLNHPGRRGRHARAVSSRPRPQRRRTRPDPAGKFRLAALATRAGALRLRRRGHGHRPAQTDTRRRGPRYYRHDQGLTSA